MLVTKKTFQISGLVVALALTAVACGKKNDSAPLPPPGAYNPYSTPYGVNPGYYPGQQPINPIYQNYAQSYADAYAQSYYTVRAQGQWGWQGGTGYGPYIPPAYSTGGCFNTYPTNCWGYQGMCYGMRISAGGEIVWKGEPMDRESIEASVEPKCERPVQAKLEDGTLVVKDQAGEALYSETGVAAVAQKCDRVRYHKENRLYEFDAKTKTAHEVSLISDDDSSQE